MNTGGPCSGLPDSCARPSHRSVANHLTCPRIAFTRYPSACWASRLCGSGLRHPLAGSPRRPAELRSSSYGPIVHLRLLSTPPRGDAVTFGYRPENACLEGTCTPLIEYTFRRTSGRPPSRPSAGRDAGRYEGNETRLPETALMLRLRVTTAALYRDRQHRASGVWDMPPRRR